jgi:hypothetical protein
MNLTVPVKKPALVAHAEGLRNIVALLEAHDRLMAQVLQLEEIERLGLKPTDQKQQLSLPEGQAAAVVLDTRWIAQQAWSR